MPSGDQSGPRGQGPMTGRGFGYCAGTNQPEWMGRGQGRRMGNGPGWRGRGRGHRNMFYATGMTGWQRADMGIAPNVNPVPAPPDLTEQPIKDPGQELAWLRQQTSVIEGELKAMQNRIAELEKPAEPK